jgi:hypothetical protein
VELIEEYTDISQPFINNKEWRTLKFFWLGFIIYTAAYTLSTVLPSSFHDRRELVQTIGLLLLVPAAFKLIKFKIENPYLRVIYILYCGWLILVLLRGFRFDYVQIREMMFDAWAGIFLYLTPLILLFPKNIFYLKRVFEVIGILSIIYIVFCLLFYKLLLNPDSMYIPSREAAEYLTKCLSIPSGFLLLTYVYHSNKRKLLAFFVIMLTLFLVIFRGRRSLIFMTICPLLFAYFIFFYINKRKLSVILTSFFLLAALSFYGVKLYNENKTGMFNIITERVDEDTRTGVEVCFYEDLQTKDWVLGRGINGEYFCPAVDTDFSNYRDMIETDYLNIILKGGIISLGLLLLITIPAIFKGLFYSKNILSKAAGIWILFWVLDLYPATVYTFTFNYLLVWISVGICYSKTIRNMPESTIKEIFSK